MKKQIILSIFISFALLLNSLTLAHAFVGNTPPLPAQQDTTDKNVNLFAGDATHSVKIEVPPGTNSLQPDLSLEYHSASARSLGSSAFISGNLFGSGWSMDFPYIYRDAKGTPDNTSDDVYKFVWKGISYDLVDQGNGNYKTKVERYLNIKHQIGSTNNTRGDYWTVQTADGTTYRLGYNGNSEVSCSNRNFTLEWVVDLVTDMHNNNLYYTYTQNPTSNDIGTIYPQKIEYNNDKSRVVNFGLDTIDSPTMANIYYQGCFVRYARNLKTITTTANGTQVKQYVLNFINTSSHALLSSVTLKGSDGTALPATTFTYNPEVQSISSTRVTWSPTSSNIGGVLGQNEVITDVNGDGLPDVVLHENDNSFTIWLNTGTGFSSTRQTWSTASDNIGGSFATNEVLQDVNRDGLPDIVLHENDNSFTVWYNTGTSFSPTRHTWSTAAANIGGSFATNEVLSDVNGDGLPDVVLHENDNSFTVWLNTGSSFSSTRTVWAPSSSNIGGSFTKNEVFTDVNGDGLVDVLLHENDNSFTVWLNTGTNFSPTRYTWSTAGANIGGSMGQNEAITDINGDGLPDVVLHENDNSFTIWLNTGTGFSPTRQTWSTAGANIGGSFGSNEVINDIDGDGLPDILLHENDTSFTFWKNNGYAPALLATVQTQKKGSISFEYTPSTKYPNNGTDSLPDLAFPVLAVSKITIDNGMSGTQNTHDVTTYNYKNGLFNWPNREFRGFGEVDETDPNGAKKQTFFKQDDGLKGTMYQQKITDASGNLYAQTDDNWASNINNGVYINTLTSEKKYSYDGSASNPKMSEIDYYYDGYGNIIKESDLGDTSATGDERYTYNEYVYNTAAYIVNTLKHTYKNASDDSTKVSETWNYYDGNTGLNDTPTKGDLTKQVKWLSGLGATNPTTTYSYDSYGNKTQETDPNNHTTSYTYDTTGTNRISTTNAKNQTTNTSYDLGTGNLLSKTDPNGFTTSYTYDVFGRISKEIAPYDTNSYPTKSYTYYDNSTAPQGKLVSQRLTSGQSGTLDAYTYIDGLGRDIQKRIPAEDTTKQIVTDTFYDPNGKVSKVSVPHLDTLNTNYATPLTGIENTITAYDPLQRVITVTNPQGTTKTTSYDHWKQTDTDENSHQKRKVMDAYNNITEVDEFNSGSTYVTTYQYNALDKLTKITDANSHDFTFTYDTLGRKVSQVDPDMGTWTYTYDGADNMTQQKDNRNKTTTKTYDELNRIASVSYPSDSGITYTYDGNNKIGTLTSVIDAAGTINYSYDNRLRKTQEQRVTDGNTWTTAYTYDAADRIVTTTKPDNEVVTNTYNAQGEVASVSGVVNNIDYNALNKVTSKTLANGQTTNYTYNTNDFRLNRIQTGTAQDVSYTYDNVGNVKTTTDNLLSKTQTFGYDTLDRLTSATESAGYNFSYTYDPIGNMTSSSGLGSTTKYTYGQNSLVHTPASSSTTTVMYDESVANGWTDASFNATNATTAQTGNVYSGSVALASAIGANGGLDLQAPMHTTTSGSDTLHFTLKASQPGQQYDIYIDSVFGQPLSQPVSLANYGNQPNQNGWTVYNIPLADLAATNVALGDIVIHNPTNNDEPIVYVDQLALTNGSIVPLTTSITDDWSSGNINTAKWNNWGGSQVSVVSNRLQISTTLGGGYYGVNSDVGGAKQDLTASYVMDQLIDAGNQSLSSWGAYPVVIDKDSNNQLYWGIETNKIRAYKRVGGTISVVNEATYNASIHKWFRIRESGGTIYWDYSTDGNSWTNFTSLADPFDVSNIIVGANVGTWQTESSTTSATFDNFNIVPAIPTSSTVTDNWSSGSINTAKWNNWGSPQTSVVSNQLKISSVLNGGYYGLDSYNGSAQDLTNSYALNELVDAGNQSLTSWEVYPLILLKNDDVNNSKLFFRLANNTLYASKVVSGVTTSLRSVSYNSSTYKWFRIRESGGTTYFDTSADGKTWTNFTSLADPFILTAVRNGMLVGTWQAESSSTSATFDNFNVPPSPPTATVTDYWSSGNIDTGKWNNWGSPQTSGVNGQLQISSVLSGGYFGLDSYNGSAQDLTGSYVIDQLVNAGNQSLASLDVYPIIIGKNDDFNNYQLYFMVANNTLYANKLIGGVTSTLRSASYNISTYKWFRIRESGGTIYYDTSSDGSNWNNFTSLNAPFNVAAVRSGMMLGTWNAESSTTTAIFDNFNIIP